MNSVSAKKARVVVMGVGNLLLKDEGLGIHVIQALQQEKMPADIDLEIIDSGVSSDALLMMERVDKLIVVDAVLGGCEPGAIYRFTPDDITQEKNIEVSVHQWGLLEGLQMMEYLDNKPRETVIIGVEPNKVEWGMELSPEIKEKVPRILELVWEEIHSGRRN